MITKKTLTLRSLYAFSGHHLYWLTAWMLLITATYYFTKWEWLKMPVLPLSLIGTAVAFYVGFKNNQSYDRLWEARKIWGAIINYSRTLGTMIKHLHADAAALNNTDQKRKEIVYRHIAYLYQLREQLLKPTEWEHVSLGMNFGTYNKKRQNQIFDSYKYELEEVENNTNKYISENEKEWLSAFDNKATQLLDKQSEGLQVLFSNNQINMMQQMELQNIIGKFYDEQGKAERIKKFPLPRMYGSFSFIFVVIFVFLLPFGLVGQISQLNEHLIWMTIPAGVIIGWIYVIMEMIGDYSENPFEGLFNDVPMLSICRTIEIDLLQMIGEKDVPKPIAAKNHILM